MRRVLWCLLYLMALYLLPRDVYSQTRADTAWIRSQTVLLTRVITNSNNSRGVKTDATAALRADSQHFWSHAATPPPPNQPPTAAFTLAKNDTTRLVRMANQSTDPEGGVLTYLTRWGDGATSTAVNPQRTYSAPGTYTVTLVATDPLGRADTLAKQVTLADPVVTTNSAPVASIAKSYDATTKTLAVNASASTDDKGVTGYSWTFWDGATASGVTATRIYAASGTYTITLTVRDAEGLTATATTQQIVADPIIVPPPPDTATSIAAPAELPRVTPAFQIPAPTRRYTITAGLQAALDTAKRGDEITLGAGLRFVGNYVLRSCAAGWITVRGTTAPLTDGTRITPATATTFAKIVSANTEPALRTSGAACRWAFRGVEVIGEYETTAFLAYGIIRFGSGGDEGQTTLASVPYDILLSHSYVHGTALHNDTRCVVLNSRNTIVRDSWISECHARGSDSQSILGWNGAIGHLIENNYLAGAGENIMYGGADAAAEALTPTDITIRRNHIIKPLTWRGGPWSIKNLLELKSARRVLIEQNVIENSWADAQEGMAVVIKSANAGCTSCAWVGTQDVTFRNNIVRNAAVGLNLQAADNSYGHVSFLHVARVSVTDNLFDLIGAEGRAALMLITGDVADISIQNNVFTHHPSVGVSRGAAAVFDYGNGAARRLDWRGNLVMHGAYGFFYNGLLGTQAFTGMAGPSYRMTGNTIVGGLEYQSKYPSGNTWLGALPPLELTRFTAATQGVVVPN